MDSGLKVPRGLDSSLIIPSSSTRRSATATNTLNTSPDLPLPNSKSDVHTKGLLLWDKLTSLRDPHSITEPPRLLHTEFVHLPSRIDFPDYYALIKKPVCFHDIWTKLERLEYSSIAEVRNDFNQCFVNAKRYNAPGSGIFLDAKKLHKVLKQWYAHITGEAEAPEDDDAPAPLPSMNTYHHQSPPTPQQPLPLHLPQQPVPIPVNYAHAHPSSNPNPNPNAEAGGPGPSTLLALPAAIPGTNFAKRGPTIKPWLTRKLAETTALVDANGRKFSDSFKSLPDKKEWAEYYKVITHPMSFDAITTKVTKRAYTSVQQFIDDVHLIFANAQFFNEESSRIWTDAQIMQLHFTEVMKEVPPTFIPPRKYNTAKRRAEAEALARGELAPPSASTTSSVKKRRVSSVAPGGGGGGSEPPEEGEEADSGDDYEGEGSVPPSAAGGGGGGGGGGGTRGPSRATSLAPLGAAPPPPLTLRQGSADPFHLPYDHHIKTEEEGLLPPVDPFAIPGSLLAEPMPPLPDLERLSRGGTPMDVDARDALVNGGGAVGEMAWGVEVGEGGEGELGGGGGGGGAAMTGLDTGDPKLVARMKQEGEGEPLITRFLLTTTPSTTPLTLLNTPLAQHSLSLPPSITRLDFTPFFSSPSPSNIVQLAVRPAGVVVEPLAELPGPEGPTHRYSLVPRRGLNVVEFVVGGGAEGRKEVYRCFVTKG